ncbi:TPT-domain-containing protein [Gonapodya prolifera JEL478]|uniref:GDP-mannose transporter n=1 Tax=Gonapodya prolifera (strain JEL478) TaxID=1344416 RepID=A0A139ARB9_GONPJ|nr:TPT-domain-containing protein [Gonapodya prolifera JEL478]|eukprot:KXS19297.1 TPT-domain-containing protein [Gonapodya prolifera JEL478]
MARAKATEEESQSLLAEPDVVVVSPRRPHPVDRVPNHHNRQSHSQEVASVLFSFDTLLTLAYIAAWYSLSLTLSVFNKWMFGKPRPAGAPHAGGLQTTWFNFTEPYDYRYPLFTSAVHMAVQFFLSALALGTAFRSWRPRKLWPDIRFYLVREFPCGVATGLDIGLSNASLRNITLTLYTMVKSSTPAAVLFFAFLFRLERVRWQLILVITIICLGVLLMTMKDRSADHDTPVEEHQRIVGIVEVLVAVILSGFRWSLTQVLMVTPRITEEPPAPDAHTHPVQVTSAKLQNRPANGHGSNPLVTNFHLAPGMCLSTAAAAILLEGWPDLTSKGPELFLLMGFAGFVAWSMILVEFGLIKHAGVVVLSVAGIFKEILTITTSHIVFGDSITTLNFVGLVVSLVGIIGFNYLKIVEHLQREKNLLSKDKDSEYDTIADARSHDSGIMRRSYTPSVEEGE